jgi:hypothetical protein
VGEPRSSQLRGANGVGEYVAVELRAAFAELVSLATPYPEPGRALVPMHAIFGWADLTFEGDGYLALQRLTHELMDHALAAGGPTRSTVQGWLAYACRMALDSDIDRGFDELVRLIDEPLRAWTVLEHVRGHFAQTPLRVGRCVVYGSLESVPQVGSESGMARLLSDETPAPVLVTSVFARDDESARVRARDRFDESRAILHLISEGIDGGKIGFSILDEAGHARSSTGVQEGFVVYRLGFDATMTLGYRGLEAGAAKDPLERTDWERRVLAAARWLRRCFTSDWPSERVAAAMSTLECLFVGGTGVRQSKGKAIADHVAPLVQIGGMTRDQVHTWIVELYKRRNDALHEGLWMLDDLDAARLVELTLSVLRWASFHLDEDHDHLEPCRACRTREEAVSSIPSP